jgi:hypothetical protein
MIPEDTVIVIETAANARRALRVVALHRSAQKALREAEVIERVASQHGYAPHEVKDLRRFAAWALSVKH